jgi:FlaA1/EpsC-like NDP-sugar epimerase
MVRGSMVRDRVRTQSTGGTIAGIRRSLSQLVVDAGLVALAYYLAFWLRFGDSWPSQYQRLFTGTWPWVVIGTALILVLSRVYQRRWRYVGQRDIELLVVRGLVIAAVLVVTIVAVTHPVHVKRFEGLANHQPPLTKVLVAVGLPSAVAVVYFLLALVFLIGVRRLVGAIADRRAPGQRAPREQGNGPVMP